MGNAINSTTHLTGYRKVKYPLHRPQNEDEKRKWDPYLMSKSYLMQAEKLVRKSYMIYI